MPTQASVLREARAQRKWVSADLGKHVQVCLACSSPQRDDCARGRVLQALLASAELQLKRLKAPPEDQLDLGLD